MVYAIFYHQSGLAYLLFMGDVAKSPVILNMQLQTASFRGGMKFIVVFTAGITEEKFENIAQQPGLLIIPQRPVGWIDRLKQSVCMDEITIQSQAGGAAFIGKAALLPEFPVNHNVAEMVDRRDCRQSIRIQRVK